MIESEVNGVRVPAGDAEQLADRHAAAYLRPGAP